MRFFPALLAALVPFIAPIDQAAAEPLPAPSSWINQRGSVLTIDAMDNEGRLEGHFVNNEADTGCTGVPYALIGKLKDDRVTFAVTFADGDLSHNCLSVTVWKGSVTGSVFETTWALAYANPDGNVEVISGADTFTRQ